MEIRTLHCFLELARVGNFTAAARALNMSQPSLSKQMRELEQELGTSLLVRGKRKTRLTEAGKYLLKNAAEIVGLAERTKQNIFRKKSEIGGDVHIAAAETRNMSLMVKAMSRTREDHAGICFHIFSGNAEAVSERLARGLADFGAFILPASLEKFDYINLPISDRWGLLLRKDHNLARRRRICPEDLCKLPLICSSQNSVSNEIAGWMGSKAIQLEIVATYTLLYNAALMVEEGIGAAICLDGIADISSSSSLCFRPFDPPLDVNMAIAWKKGGPFSRAASVFHDTLYKEIVRYKDSGL